MPDDTVCDNSDAICPDGIPGDRNAPIALVGWAAILSAIVQLTMLAPAGYIMSIPPTPRFQVGSVVVDWLP